MDFRLEQRPLIIAIAGPNGAGKSTFFDAFLRPAGLPFVNADVLARDVGLDPYAAADEAARLREEMIAARISFVFETVLSDPVGEKVELLRQASTQGYTVVLCFVGLESAAMSEERVALRVNGGGHDVPTSKLATRFARTLDNLVRAVALLPYVLVFDHSVLTRPYRLVAKYRDGNMTVRNEDPPEWFKMLALPKTSTGGTGD